MATFREEDEYYEPRRTTTTLAERVRKLESEKRLAQQAQKTEKETKQFSWPFRWKQKFLRSRRNRDPDQVLVVFFNKKNEIELPKFMPIFVGNMIVYKNKPYEFDPRAIWTIKGVRGNPRVYCIREIDRRPIKNKDGSFKRDKKGRIIYSVDSAISNNDLDEVRARGDSTESDEFLIKAALKAQTSQIKKQVNFAAIAIVALIVIGGLIWFLTSGSGTPA